MILLVLGSFVAGVLAGVFVSRLANGLEQVHGSARHPRTRAIATTAAFSPSPSPSPPPEVPMSFSDEADERTLSQF